MRVCLLCKHFFFDAGHPRYSEYTPAEEWEAGCHVKAWRMSGHDDIDENMYRRNMLRAQTCDSYEQVDSTLLIGNWP